MNWNDLEEICALLSKQEPPVDPRDMSQSQIAELVLRLPGFDGEAAGFNAGHIEAIRAGVWWGS